MVMKYSEQGNQNNALPTRFLEQNNFGPISIELYTKKIISAIFFKK